MQQPHICQAAIIGYDTAMLRNWYQTVFGLEKSGWIYFFPPSTTTVQGIEKASETLRWMVDKQDYFQLEIFHYLNPKSKPRPVNWRPCDIGYNMLGIAVDHFDRTLTAIENSNGHLLGSPVGEVGTRRICAKDPEGNLLEIYESDPLLAIEGTQQNIVRPEITATFRTMRVSVPSLEDARAYFVDALQLIPVEQPLHTPDDEAMWGLEGARASSLTVRAANFLVELVEYHDPEPSPRPDGYQICDQGFMNIALGYDSTFEYDRAFYHALANGATPNNPEGTPSEAGIFRVMYVNDPHGFSIEMLFARRAMWSLSGFNPSDVYIVNEITINASKDKVWHAITDHANLGDWTIFKGKVINSGSDHPNGTGCVRELSFLGSKITEEVTEWHEGNHYAYQLRTGAPFKRHQGDIFLTELEDGSTHIRYTIRITPQIPLSGLLTEKTMKAIFGAGLNKLKKNLEA